MNSRSIRIIGIISIIIFSGVIVGNESTKENLSGTPVRTDIEQTQREYLDNLLKILPEVPSWNQWLEESGELPPDFNSLPRNNKLQMQQVPLIILLIDFDLFQSIKYSQLIHLRN